MSMKSNIFHAFPQNVYRKVEFSIHVFKTRIEKSNFLYVFLPI